jgi:hypothetical protein
MTTTLRSIDEWKALPELRVGRIATPQERGTIYSVTKVSILVVSVSDCQIQGLSEVKPIVGDKTALPTITVSTEAGFTQYRLPVHLAAWAASTCALAEKVTDLLPSDVEFSDLNGVICADLL